MFTTSHRYAHIYSRGVDKRSIFLDQSDVTRFLWSLRVFNCARKTGADNQSFWRRASSAQHFEEKPLVQVLAYATMTNHFHLLLHECEPEGIAKFMQKLSTGYTLYFNRKYGRSGSLFEARYRRKTCTTETYFRHLFRYIHLNPLKAYPYPDAPDKPEYVILDSSLNAWITKRQEVPIICPAILHTYTPENKAELLGYLTEVQPPS